jgi:hypothetical protein
MPIINPQVDLRDSFPYTNLDLQDSGPINVPLNNHQQQWTPSSGFTQDPKGQKQDGVLRYKGFDGPEGLDLENNGPRNVSIYNHQQNFTPSNKFKDSTEGGQGKLWDDATQTGIGFDGPGELDLQNNGPRNASKYNHQQQWTPTTKYLDDTQGQKQGGNLDPQAFEGPLNLDIETNSKTFFPKSPSGKQQFGFTQQWGPNANEYRLADLGEDGVGLYNGDNSLKGNLDVENNGPRNVAEYKHEQLYTPDSTYENILKEQGLEKGSKLYTKGFDKNYNGRGYGGDFDIENNDPNRANPLGAKSSNVIFSTLNGRTIQTQTQHQYTPKNPYISTGDPVVGTAGGGNDINAATGASNQI